jgi:hypothetical protein
VVYPTALNPTSSGSEQSTYHPPTAGRSMVGAAKPPRVRAANAADRRDGSRSNELGGPEDLNGVLSLLSLRDAEVQQVPWPVAMR